MYIYFNLVEYSIDRFLQLLSILFGPSLVFLIRLLQNVSLFYDVYECFGLTPSIYYAIIWFIFLIEYQYVTELSLIYQIYMLSIY